MQIEGSVEVKAPRVEVFRLMVDPGSLSRVVPGCEKLALSGNNEYDVTLKIGVAAIKGVYAGKIRLDEMVAPESYKMMVEGSSAAGIVKGAGHVRLVEDGEKTRVLYNGDVLVSGKIAAVGNRFLGMIAKMLIGKFFDDMAKEIQKEQLRGRDS